VNSLIDEYIQDFWDDNVERAIIQAELQKHGWTYNGGYSDKTKKELNPEFRTYVLQYIQPLIERMYKNYLFKAKQLQQQQIQQFGQMLNQEHQIRCMVELDDGDEAEQYEGAKVVFKVAGTIKKMWQGFLNKEAIMDLYCTKAGFIHAGCPTSATLILDPADEKKSEKYNSKVDLKSAGDETQVVFSLEKRFTEYLWKLCDYKLQEKGPIKEFTAGSLKACEAFVASDVKKYADLVNSNSFTDPGKATTNFKDLDEFGSLELVSKELYRRTMLGSVISKDYNASADFNEQQGRASTRNLKNDVYYKLFGKDVLVVGNYEFLQTKDPKKATTEYTVYVYGYVKGIKVKE
jgi:hypothetical protein